MATFTLQLRLKSGKKQYCLRSLPGEFDELADQVAPLKAAIAANRNWSDGKAKVSWNGTTQYESTLSYYPKAGYLEINVNKGSALCNWAENSWEPSGQPATHFSATYTTVNAQPVLNLVKMP